MPLYSANSDTHDADQLADGVHGFLEHGALVVGEVELDDLFDAASAELDGDADEEAVDAVLAVQVGGAGHDHLLVEDDRVNHLEHGGGRSVVRAALLEQVDDLGAAVAGALDDLGKAVGGDELGQGDASDGGEAGEGDHGVAVAAEHERLHVTHGDVELLGDEGAEAGSVEHTRLAHDALPGEAADLQGELGHGVEGVGDADQDGVGRALDDLLRDLSDDALVGADEVVAAHAGLAGDAGGDDDDIGVFGLVVGVGAGDE